MIDYLHLKNFRSILDAKLTFSSSGLSVLVGANGSGKSNIVRALDLIAHLQQGDLSSTVATQGGQRSIVPKSINFRKLISTRIHLKYGISLLPPDGYRPKLPAPSASHLLAFRIHHRNAVRIDSESLVFENPLAVAEALAAVPETKKSRSPKWSRGRPSGIEFIRTAANRVRVEAKPRFTDANYQGYMTWFGFPVLESVRLQVKSRSDLRQLISDLNKRSVGIEGDPGPGSLLFQLARPLLVLSQHATMFRNTGMQIKRFDFHVSRLRGDKQPTPAIELESDGENLPAVVRWLKGSGKERVSWERILETLSNLAPYVFDVRHNLLRSGREYIEFLETKSGRAVESWDASDGTLRALAILIALESHPAGSTMILEEPERGLHPWAVRYLFDHIRDVIQRRSIQVLVTTHSAQVLEEAQPSEVIIVTRTHEGGTKMNKASELLPAPGKTGDLGRLWVKGLLGGHPHDVH